MPTLTYWVANVVGGPSSDNIRTRTRNDCYTMIKLTQGKSFGKPHKIEIRYDDALHLAQICLRGWINENPPL